ncbi:branched-chain amino acid ABC transporter permease [Caproiciproducens sp. R1]|jgi:Branched-chain amino acid ABC-type transport system, permease components|uniref:Branched-chain amino acid ABC transporter permease n=1 Tax=Caproiciproducens faecalis TaxID=2820301 RepID=A0ABS7DL97_9FIRM|nr:branched-chain amino acid ABC transporter permease [Caproiciproducens faecalis]MBW7572052.1 branched-chain amino acid ABC transporter permease [Caproiciproducens faecalis]
MLQVIINGLLIGGVYALVAVGITMIHGVMKIVNFAQGDFLAMGLYFTYAMYSLMPQGSLPYWLLVPVGAAMYLAGCIFFSTTIKKVIGKGDSNYILLTIGLSYIIQNVIQLIFGPDFKSVAVSDQLRNGALALGSVSLSTARVIAFIAAAAFAVFVNWFLASTDIGRAMRATSENRVIAESLGIKTSIVFITAFALGTVFAGISGLLISPIFLLSPKVGSQFSIIAMSAMVLGGLGNIKGALIGGLIIGLVESMTSSYAGVLLSQAAINAVLMLVLIIRPYGLFGKKGRAS